MKCPTLLQEIETLYKSAFAVQRGSKQLNRGQRIKPMDLSRLHAFYSMPFSPGLLDPNHGIFKGWETVETDEFWHDFRTGPHHDYMILYPMMDDNYQYSIQHAHAPNSRYYDRVRTNKPQTISHFIDDCTRAGIPLTLTPYGVALLKGGAG